MEICYFIINISQTAISKLLWQSRQPFEARGVRVVREAVTLTPASLCMCAHWQMFSSMQITSLKASLPPWAYTFAQINNTLSTAICSFIQKHPCTSIALSWFVFVLKKYLQDQEAQKKATRSRVAAGSGKSLSGYEVAQDPSTRGGGRNWGQRLSNLMEGLV